MTARCETPAARLVSHCLAQEFQHQPRHLFRPLLLHPVAGAGHEVATEHLRAGLGLHLLEVAWLLIDAPIARARDEAGRLVDRAAGEYLQIGVRRAGGAAAIPV